MSLISVMCAFSVSCVTAALYTAATAVYGAVHGQGTGPQLTACSAGNFTSFVNFVPLGNCTTMLADPTCSHERDVGVQCSPGQCELVYLYILLSLHYFCMKDLPPPPKLQ